jgi:hypothetical protein
MPGSQILQSYKSTQDNDVKRKLERQMSLAPSMERYPKNRLEAYATLHGTRAKITYASCVSGISFLRRAARADAPPAYP